ncbi:MAG: ABC transporter permease [Clostridiales bacterium]|jgi:NitT/TauT family transport system permease protein|nr:ABC transporter permease [Clostridiales bacterium]
MTDSRRRYIFAAHETQSESEMNCTVKKIKSLLKNGWEFLLANGFITWGLLLLIWQLGSLTTNAQFLPGPIAAIKGGIEIVQNGLLLDYLGISFLRVLRGWLLGIAIAVPIGLAVGQFRTFRLIFEPFVNFFRFVPAIGFITLFLMWFGIGESSKVALITYAAIFPVSINTIAGVMSISPITIQVAQSQGASPFQIFCTVTIPASVPQIFTGIRLGLGGSIVSIVGAEMLAAQKGIGYLIYTSRLYYRTDWIFTGIFILGLSGFLADRLLRLFGRTALKRFGVRESK